MTNDTYLTLSKPSEAVYKEKGSRFLAFAFSVDTEEDVKFHLLTLRKKYYDATHHCYAYSISGGHLLEISRINDDGEPGHTAGTPIMNQIRSKKLSNVLVVVVRYFGGTKLGVGGLINAYKTVSEEALTNAALEEKIVKEEFNILFAYQKMNEVMKLIKSTGSEIVSQEMAENCRMSIRVRKSLAKQVLELFQQLEGLKLL